MPVEIRELIIRAVVDATRDRQESKPDSELGVATAGFDDIVQECVRQVLKILKKSGER